MCRGQAGLHPLLWFFLPHLHCIAISIFHSIHAQAAHLQPFDSKLMLNSELVAAGTAC